MEMEQSMTLVEHLSELRTRLIRVLLLFILFFIVGFIVAKPVIQFLITTPTAAGITLNVFHLTDAMRIYIQAAFIVALAGAIPYIAFEAWRFVTPGLTEKERKIILPFIPASGVLFLLGLLFGYGVIFPLVFKFLFELSGKIAAEEMFGLAQYFGTLFNIVLPFGLLFELPLVVMLLTRLGILHPERLKKIRKYAYMVLVIIGVSITPPDFISDILVIIPLLFIYEVSVWLAGIVVRKRQ